MGGNIKDGDRFVSMPVALSASIAAARPVAMTDLDTAQHLEERAAFAEAMQTLSPLGQNQYIAAFLKGVSAGQFVFSRQHVERVERFNAAFNKAVVDLVERWYVDDKRALAARMPLLENEERILRWIAGEGRDSVPPYEGRQGNWRPDYLLEKVTLPDGTVTEGVKVCEVNARFPWNGFVAIPMAAQVMDKMGIAKSGMRVSMAGNALDEIFKSLEIDFTKPLHIVNEKFHMRDPWLLKEVITERSGLPVRVIKPSDLKWLPDKDAADGSYAVFCTTEDGKGVERVYQVDFELEQEEYAAIDFEMLCQLSRNCINDLRTVFLVNDQRFLGVVYEELDNLVSRGALTQHEADLIEQSLAPSFLPSSSTWSKVIQESKADPRLKDKWVLKAARGGLGQGHVFGQLVENTEWLATLTAAQATNSDPEHGSYVLQKYIEQTEYDTWSHLNNAFMRSHMVSSYFSVNGRFMGLGGVRTALVNILLMSEGVGYVMIALSEL